MVYYKKYFCNHLYLRQKHLWFKVPKKKQLHIIVGQTVCCLLTNKKLTFEIDN